MYYTSVIVLSSIIVCDLWAQRISLNILSTQYADSYLKVALIRWRPGCLTSCDIPCLSRRYTRASNIDGKTADQRRYRPSPCPPNYLRIFKMISRIEIPRFYEKSCNAWFLFNTYSENWIGSTKNFDSEYHISESDSLLKNTKRNYTIISLLNFEEAHFYSRFKSL